MRSRTADGGTAAKSVRGVRTRRIDAVLRAGDQTPHGAHAQRRSAEDRARLQPALLAARHPDDPVRRRDRHLGRPLATGARMRADGDAVVASRTVDSRRRKSRRADRRRWGARVRQVQRRRPAPRSELAVELDERRIRARKELPEIGWGECKILETDAPSVLALRYVWRNTALVTLHNFADSRRRCTSMSARRTARCCATSSTRITAVPAHLASTRLTWDRTCTSGIAWAGRIRCRRGLIIETGSGLGVTLGVLGPITSEGPRSSTT